MRDYENLRRPSQSIKVAFDKHDEETRRKFRLRLNTSVVCLRYLLPQCLTFRHHEKYEELKSIGNFLELAKSVVNLNELIDIVVLGNASKTKKLVSHII